MRCDTIRGYSRPFRLSGAMPRLALVILIGTLAAACSSEATRFSDNPFTSPFGGRTADATPPVPSVPTGKVQSRALPPVGQQQSRAGSFSETDRGIVTGSIPSHPSAPQPVKSADVGNWTSTGGTSLTVGASDTIATLSSRYGVPETALRAANNLKAGANPAPGSQIIIPVYRYGPAVGEASPKKSTSDRLATQKTDASRLAAASTPKKPTSQETKSAAATPSPEPAKAKLAATATSQSQSVKTKPQEVAKAEPAEEAEAQSGGKSDAPQFRWPARGRVISRFGGDGNDGINISVPEGTSVRAAEDGTVAYVGDEIKNYGKLVLVRHANGWISAYANNGDLLVKKGDNVKRGQVLAKSGQTGNVASPQLHFELRKGKTPVDPQQYLAGG
ncbi:MAG: M23 family metallopeptidase [Hyphomicrobiales bacterium]|nr:M23 family metallopeptidase [Hyphomicrobiales bacterium]